MSEQHETLQSVWNDLGAQRGTGIPDVRASLIRIARGEIPGQLTPNVVRLALNFPERGRSSGYQVTPPIVIDFMAALAAIHNARRILDPVGNVGLLAAGAKLANPESSVELFESKYENVQIARALLTDEAVIRGCPVSEAADSQGIYDAILCDPPMGSSSIAKNDSAGPVEARNLAEQLLLWSCHRITTSGFAAITTTQKTLTNEQLFSAISDSGCRVRAVFHVPEGTRAGTLIGGEIFVIEHGKQDKIFIGQVSHDPDQRDLLLKNYFRQKDGSHASLGRLRSVDELLSYKAIEAQDRLREKVRRRGLSRVAFEDLVLASSKVDIGKDSLSPDGSPSNSIYLAQPLGRFFADLQSVPEKSRNVRRPPKKGPGVKADFSGV